MRVASALEDSLFHVMSYHRPNRNGRHITAATSLKDMVISIARMPGVEESDSCEGTPLTARAEGTHSRRMDKSREPYTNVVRLHQ